MDIVPSRPFDNLLTSTTPVPSWWTSRLDQIEAFLDAEVDPQQVQPLATSPAGRDIRYVTYGEPEPDLRGRANFNSALGSCDAGAFFRRGERRRPVLMILAGVHGQEVESMVAALSAISILETGTDLMGTDQPALADSLGRLRLIVIPLANPDGRARVPYDGWVGLPEDEMHRIGQGTRRDGTSYGWPGCKQVHPMAGDVGSLGGYFDDAGVNMMHDEWTDPMSRTTHALLRLIRREGPDMVLNCHSHGTPPSILSLAYAPLAVKQDVAAFTTDLYARYDDAHLPHGPVPAAGIDGPADTTPPALNLTGMMYHTGAALPITFESSHGVSNRPEQYTYEDLLRIHHILFQTAGDWLWTHRA